MIDFIKNNVELIVLVGACLVDIVLFVMTIFKKKVNPSLDEVLVWIPDYIKFAEEKFGAGNGLQKKNYVLDLCKALYKHLTGVSISENSHIYSVISKTIENVLSTPQKKGKK